MAEYRVEKLLHDQGLDWWEVVDSANQPVFYSNHNGIRTRVEFADEDSAEDFATAMNWGRHVITYGIRGFNKPSDLRGERDSVE